MNCNSRARSALILASVGLVLAGCSAEKAGNSQLAPAPQEAPAWELKLSAECAPEVGATCIAAYGFKVKSNGTYEVGPAANGQIHRGKLTSTDLKTVTDTLLLDSTSAENCAPRANDETAPLDQVVFKQRDREATLVRHNGSEICYAIATEQGKQLHKAIRELAKKHYPLPFPDECLASIDAVEELYPALSHCSVDAECSNIDQIYSPIPIGEVQYVTTRTCSRINPMIAGNAAAVAGAQLKLLAARDAAKSVCGTRIKRDACAQIDGALEGFQNHRAPAVCGQGTCQPNPSLYF